MNKHICTAALAAAALLALLPGCTTYDDKKHAARTKWDKVSAQARVTVARDLFENGRYEDAQATAQQCLQSDPELPEAHLLVEKDPLIGNCRYFCLLAGAQAARAGARWEKSFLEGAFAFWGGGCIIKRVDSVVLRRRRLQSACKCLFVSVWEKKNAPLFHAARKAGRSS